MLRLLSHRLEACATANYSDLALSSATRCLGVRLAGTMVTEPRRLRSLLCSFANSGNGELESLGYFAVSETFTSSQTT